MNDASGKAGFEAARRVVTVGRSAFFGSVDHDLPKADSAQIAADDLLPQFGFVGSRYNVRRILLLGINPGNGPRKERNSGDKIALPALASFVGNPTPDAFVVAQRAYKQVCQGWAVWGRQCDILLRDCGLGLEDIAFTNALPWRTASQSAFSRSIACKTAQLYAGPVVRELEPSIIIAVGKKAAEVLGYAGLMSESVVVWNRAQALRPTVIAEREAAVQQFKSLLALR